MKNWRCDLCNWKRTPIALIDQWYMVGFIVSYYSNESYTNKSTDDKAVSATAGTSTPLAGDYKVDSTDH